MAKYQLTGRDGFDVLTVQVNGELYTLDNEHPNFQRVLDTVRAGDTPDVTDFDPAGAISESFEKVTERVSVSHGVVYFDGDPLHSVLTEHIVRFLREGVENWKPLVNFLERVAQNPDDNSREQLYNFLNHRFTITSGGRVIAYKGVRVTGEEGKFTSISSGTATVDGTVHTGQIPNYVGAVVEMPRSRVANNPDIHCHTGLHVGTWEYASGFAQGAVLEVTFDPRDAVSVPNDHQAQKLRVCRYTVTDVLDAPHSSAYLDSDDSDEDEDYLLLENIDSDAVSAIEYEDGVLYVQARSSGLIYEYDNVPFSVAQDFVNAESKGQFWRERIQGTYKRA